MVKNIASVAVLVLIAAVLINDGGRFIQARYELGNVTRDAASACADEAKRSHDRNTSWQAGEQLAAAQDVAIYGFDMTPDQVHVWTRMPVKGTWLFDRVAAFLAKKPADTPFTIDDELSVLIQ